MIKIQSPTTPITPNVDQTSTEKSGKSASTSGVGAFNEIFMQQIKGTQEAEKTAPLAPVTQISGATQASEAQRHALQIGEDSVTMLDMLSNTLIEGDNDIEKHLDTIGSLLMKQTEALRDVRDMLEGHDPLKETVNEIGVKTAVEAHKIQRGDYSRL